MPDLDQLLCPDCRAPLEPHEHEGEPLDSCPADHGIWLDRGELRAVVVSDHAARSPEDIRQAREAASFDGGQATVAEIDRQPRACPRCTVSMQLTEYPGSGVPIDVCPEHGTWLDLGELERIEAYAQGMREQLSRGAAGDRAAAADSGTRVRGLDVPGSLLASLRRPAPPTP